MTSSSQSNRARRVVLPAVATLALGLSATACGAANEAAPAGDNSPASATSLSGTLRGAGSSAQESAMDAWRAAFQTSNPDVTVNYDPAGSGAGVEQFTAGGTDFAGSDKALDPDAGDVAAATERCGGDVIEVPDYVSPIALIFNVPGVLKLQLDGPTIAKIFAGTITHWDDPAIAAQNEDARLPDLAIAPVHRSDKSGTTNNVTDYLHQAGGGAWKDPAGEVWPIASGEGAQGTSGVVAAVKAGKGTIGYADASQAGSLSTVAVKVGSSYVAPSADGAAKALADSPVETGRSANDIAVQVNRTTTTPGAYPLLLTSYLIACPSYADGRGAAVKAFLGYVVSSEGQQAAADQAGSAPLPPSLRTKVAGIVDSIKG